MNLKSFILAVVILSNSTAISSTTSTTNSPEIEHFFINECIQMNLLAVNLSSSDLQNTTVITPDSTVTKPPNSQNHKEYHKFHPDTIYTIIKKHDADPFKMPIVKIPEHWYSEMPVMVPDTSVNFTLKIIPPNKIIISVQIQMETL
jgi:hypothetical protein